MEKYIQLLKTNRLRITPQRLAVLDYLDTHHNHPTAEEIYHHLKQTNPSLSKTTVYNTLEILKKHNIIHTLTITEHERRYDFRQEKHHHFLCRNCKTIQDIDIQCPNINKLEDLGYKIEELHGYFKGICPQCLKKKGG